MKKWHWVPLAVALVCLVCLIFVRVHQVRQTDKVKGQTTAEKSASRQATSGAETALSRRGNPPTPSEAVRSSGIPKNEDPKNENATDVFHRTRLSAQLQAEEEVSRILRARGGEAALDHVRQAMHSEESTLYMRLKRSYLARLIPFIATEAPGSQSLAVVLSRELLQDKKSDEWIRFQLVAGLGGLRSTDTVSYTDEQGSFEFSYQATEVDPSAPKGAYERSLASVVRLDPQLRQSLIAALSEDASPSVRALAAESMGKTAHYDYIAALSAAVTRDEFFYTRSKALEALAGHQIPDLASVVLHVSKEDKDAFVRSAAVRLLPRVSSYDQSMSEIFESAISSDAYSKLRPAFAEAGFEFLKSNPTGDLHTKLVRMLLATPSDSKLVRAYVSRALETGRTEFLPLFYSLERTIEDSPAREMLRNGIKKLEDYPNYSVRAERIRSLTEIVSSLRNELSEPNITESQWKRLVSQIEPMMREIGQLQLDNRK